MGNIQRIDRAQKNLQGSGRYVKNTPSTSPIARLWRPPTTLGKKAKEFFLDVGRHLVSAGVLTQLDRHTFTELSQLYQQVCDLRELLMKDGYVTYDEEGKPARHPATKLYTDALTSYVNMSQRFGLTPADRQRLDLPVDRNTKDSSREFLGL